MRALLVALLLAAPVFAGCLQAPTDDALTGSGLSSVDATPARVQSFLPDGTLVPVEEALGTAEYVLTGYRGAEPNMGITRSGAIFATASDLVIRSTDGGATWETAYALGLESYGAPVDPVDNTDPMLWVDPVTDRVINAPMFPALACVQLAWSEDDGESWTERGPECPHLPVMDHQKLATGVPGPEPNPFERDLHETVYYLCYNALVSTDCVMSYDGGVTWPHGAVVMNEEEHDCGGLNGVPGVSPQGVVVVPVSKGCSTVKLAVSYDSGLTWTVREGPEGYGGVANDPEVAFTEDGSLFVLWAGDDHVTYLARSPDLGQTWDGVWRITPPDVRTTVFWALAAGEDGRIAAGFLGTRDYEGDPSDADADARWHLWIVTSDDADTPEPTFTAHQVTPEEDPVQVGCIWMRGFPGNPCRNLLDFIDGGVSPEGEFHVIYTEGCTDGCAGNPEAKPEDSRDRQIAMAKLGGWSLHG